MVSIDRELLEPMLLKKRHLVVCVDDDPGILSSLRRCLRKEPYELVTVGTADEALELIGHREVSLLVTDQRMPGMCGADLFEEVKRRSPGTHRVMLTGYPGSTRVSYGLAHEIEWMISKPWNDEALRLTLRQLLHEHETTPSSPESPGPLAGGESPSKGTKHTRRSGTTAPTRRAPGPQAPGSTGVEGRLVPASPESASDPPASPPEWKDAPRTLDESLPGPGTPGAAPLGTSAQAHQKERLSSIGQLTSGVVHEINNPVGSILSNLSTLLDYGRGFARLLEAALDLAHRLETCQETATSLEEFNRIHREIDPEYIIGDFEEAILQSRKGAERIRDFAGCIAQYAELEEGEPKCVDLVGCLEGALRMCWNEIKFKASLRREYSEVPLLPGSPLCLEQVFVILLLNAARAIEKKSELYLSVAREGDFAVVRLRDSARGISPEDLDRLFEPPAAQAPGEENPGLGLHLAFEIVRAHRGTIDAKSGTGGGTEFLVRLPLAHPAGGIS